MSNMKHTPGPWICSDYKPIAVENEDGTSFVAWTPEISDVTGTRIAQITMMTYKHQGKRLTVDNMNEARANACLIETAPKLLEIAQTILLSIDGGGNVVTFQQVHVDELRAVIAKATAQ